MAKQLTREAIQAIHRNADLYAQVCKVLEIKPVSLPKLIQRGSERLTIHDVVIAVSKATGLRPSQIIERAKIGTAA